MASLTVVSLQVFADVVALGSFTAAAERQGISQPAVSFHIRQLEQRFGVPLIERTGRRAVPTAAGAELARSALGVTAAMDDTLAAMARFRPGDSARLRIATGATACVALLPPVLRALRERLPATTLSVTTGNSPEIAHWLEDDLVDVGLVTLPLSGRGLAASVLFEDEIVVLARAGTVLPERPDPAALLEQPIILFEPEGTTRGLIEHWFAGAGVPFRPAMTIGSTEAIRDLVGMGLGSALLSRMALPPGDPTPGLTVRPLAPRLYRAIGLATRRDRARTPAVEAFVALLPRAIRSLGSGQAG